MSSELERIEIMCIQNRALLVAIADVLIAEQQATGQSRGKPMQKVLKELDRAIIEARLWREPTGGT